MTLEEYTRARLAKEGAKPEQIDKLIADMVTEFGPAHMAQTMPEKAIAITDAYCDSLRDASPEVLEREEREIMERRAKLIEGN